MPGGGGGGKYIDDISAKHAAADKGGGGVCTVDKLRRGTEDEAVETLEAAQEGGHSWSAQGSCRSPQCA